jgi:ankyrin repeat protein
MNSLLARRRVLTMALIAVSLAPNVARATTTEAPKPPSSAAGGHIVPRPEPREIRPFTLEDRYLDAVRRDDMAMMKLSLEKGADLHAKDGFQRSALLLAARDARDLEMVKFLHERGLPVDDADVRGRTPLGYAAGNGDLAIVSYLLDQGTAVSTADGQEQTPLYHAVLGGSRETVARLLAAGAEVNVHDQFHDTPLMGACAKGFDEIAKLLVDAGADPSLRDQEGRTARDRALPTATFCRSLGAGEAPR